MRNKLTKALSARQTPHVDFFLYSREKIRSCGLLVLVDPLVSFLSYFPNDEEDHGTGSLLGNAGQSGWHFPPFIDRLSSLPVSRLKLMIGHPIRPFSVSAPSDEVQGRFVLSPTNWAPSVVLSSPGRKSVRGPDFIQDDEPGVHCIFLAPRPSRSMNQRLCRARQRIVFIGQRSRVLVMGCELP